MQHGCGIGQTRLHFRGCIGQRVKPSPFADLRIWARVQQRYALHSARDSLKSDETPGIDNCQRIETIGRQLLSYLPGERYLRCISHAFHPSPEPVLLTVRRIYDLGIITWGGETRHNIEGIKHQMHVVRLPASGLWLLLLA
jgi:hypothetical protein